MAQIHLKKRNRLDHKKLRDLVHVKYNQTLEAHVVKKDKGDPIVLRNIDDCNNERLTGMMEAGEEPVFDVHNLTWNVVAETAGVEKETRHSRQPQNSNPTYRGALTSTSTSRSKGRGGRRGRATSQTTHTLQSLLVEKSTDDEGEFEDDVLKDDYSDIDENMEDGDGDD